MQNSVRVVGDQKPVLRKDLFEFRYTWVVSGDLSMERFPEEVSSVDSGRIQ